MLNCPEKSPFGAIAQDMITDWRKRKAWRRATSCSMAATWIMPDSQIKAVVGTAQAVSDEEHFPSLFLLLEHWKPLLHFQW